MFDVGFAELFLLSLIGLLVLGPERLPAVARTLGGFVRKARVSYFNLKRTVEAELQAAEAADSLKQAKKEIESVQQEVKALGDKLSEDQTAGLTPTASDPAPPEAAPSDSADSPPRPPFSSEAPAENDDPTAADAETATIEPAPGDKTPPPSEPVDDGATDPGKKP